eukprot:jgi/Botrbrau1/7216/Bobra.0021s0002.1
MDGSSRGKESTNGLEGFGAAHYSFFGDINEDSLEGGLEAGVDAPPEEEFTEGTLETYGLEDYADPDLSYASMFANKLALEDDANGAALLGVDTLGGGRQADDGRWDLQRPGGQVDQAHQGIFSGGPFGGGLGLGFSSSMLGFDTASLSSGGSVQRNLGFGLQTSQGGFGSPQNLQQMQSGLGTSDQQRFGGQLSSPGSLQNLQVLQSVDAGQDYGGQLTDAAIVSMSRGGPSQVPRLNISAALQEQQQASDMGYGMPGLPQSRLGPQLGGLGGQSLGPQSLGGQGLGAQSLAAQSLGAQGLGPQSLGAQGLGAQSLGAQGLGGQAQLGAAFGFTVGSAAGLAAPPWSGFGWAAEPWDPWELGDAPPAVPSISSACPWPGWCLWPAA